MKDEWDKAQGHAFTFEENTRSLNRYPTDCADRSIAAVYLATIPAYLLFQIAKRSTLEVINEEE